MAARTGNPKFEKGKNTRRKVKRLFIDIYKRVLIRVSKRMDINLQKMTLND